MTKIDKHKAALADFLTERFKKEGLPVPATLPDEIATMVHEVTEEEFRKAVRAAQPPAMKS